MKSLPRTPVSATACPEFIQSFFRKFNVVSILLRCGAAKTRGRQAGYIFQWLFALAFSRRSMTEALPSFDGGKDMLYRFLNSPRVNWTRFLLRLAAQTIRFITPLTSEERVNVFIVDDTVYERPCSKRAELVTKLYDHARKRYVTGFRLLTLGWSDGNTFLPVTGALLSSAKKAGELLRSKIDKRTVGFAGRRTAVTKAPNVTLAMLDSALDAGLPAKYVLFDSWFTYPVTVKAVTDRGLDVIGMVKKTKKVHYHYNGQAMSALEIYKRNRKRRGRSKYLLSVEVALADEERRASLPARLVYVRNRNRRGEYLILLCTDMALSAEEIIRIYGKRWGIETFFRVCKQNLRLAREGHPLSYDAMTASVSIVFARYLALAVESRVNVDDRTIGEIFADSFSELADIGFAEAYRFLVALFTGIVAAKLFLSEDEAKTLVEIFLESLPGSLKTKLMTETER
jgi:hypothetical protein